MTLSEAVANTYEKVMHRQEDGNQKAAGLNPGARRIFGRVQISRLLVFPIRHSGNREKVKKKNHIYTTLKKA